MSLAYAPDSTVWTPSIVPHPEPPPALKIKRSKSGKIQHGNVCAGCKAKVGHKDGCKAQAASLDRLYAWARYGAWQRTLNADAYMRTDLSGFNLTMLPYPSQAVCTSCQQEEWEHREQRESYGRYSNSTRVTRPAADHAFIAGSSNTPGLHPRSTWAVQYGADTIFPKQLTLSANLLTELCSAAPQSATETQLEETASID